MDKLKTLYGVGRAIFYTKREQYLYKDSPHKSRFIVEEPTYPSPKKIYADEYIEEYSSHLILKNIYIDPHQTLPSDNIDRIKATKHFAAIQTSDGQNTYISYLQNQVVLSGKDVNQAITKYETPIILIAYGYLLPMIIWQMQGIYQHCQHAGIDPNAISILSIKKNTDYQTPHQLYTNLFKKIKPPDEKNICLFKQLILFKPFPHNNRLISSQTAQKFRSFVLSGFGIDASPAVKRVKRLTLVIRRDYPSLLGKTNLKIVYRKIANEDSFIAALKQYLPNNVELQAVELNQFDMKKQLEIINNTDILISLHGAALAFSAFLPDKAGVFEIIPLTSYTHHFTTYYTVAVNRGLFYKSWVNLNPYRKKSSPAHQAQKLADKSRKFAEKDDLIELPAKSIAKKLISLINTINNANT